MCGIFGWLPPRQMTRHDMRPVVEAFFSDLALRGPNDRGFTAFTPEGRLAYDETGASQSGESDIALLLGQTRLSIIDLSSAGHQPMRSSDGRYTLVYNGEVYNYLELRRELETGGVSFRSHTDSEVVLQALVHWGPNCLLRFTGMFAFVLYDAEEQTLFCARDFFGIKPLFWTSSPYSGFAFASELPALFNAPGVKRRLNRQNAYRYLISAFVDDGDHSLLEDFYQLPPAHWMRVSVKTGAVEAVERYWQVPLPEPRKISFNEAAEELRRLFLNSVKLHLRSDVPLGVALSGGIDSSAIACAVRHLEPDMPLHTFTYTAADSPDISEEKWADIVIKHTGAVAHKTVVEPQELVDDLDLLIRRLGEPFGSTSIYAQHRVFRLVKENGIVVTLEGQGADEMLAGYFGYPHYRMMTLLKKRQFVTALHFINSARKWPGRNASTMLKQMLRPYIPARFLALAHRAVGRPIDPQWLNERAFKERGVEFTIDWSAGIYASPDKVREILAHQLTWHGLPNLLRHGDRNAMSSSIESRVPFCTKEMAEFCLSLPENYLIADDGTTKAVFRKAMRGIVPDVLLDRRDKIGFATPEQQWLSSLAPWVEESLQAARSSALFDADVVMQEWKGALAGSRPFDWRIWRWVNYLRWVQIFNIQE